MSVTNDVSVAGFVSMSEDVEIELPRLDLRLRLDDLDWLSPEVPPVDVTLLTEEPR